MKLYHTKNISIAGLAATIALAAPLSAAANTDKTQGSAELQNSSALTIQSYVQSKAASDIIGMNVQSDAATKFGKVDDMFIDMESGNVIAVVVTTSTGPINKGDSRYLLSVEDLQFDDNKKYLQTDLTEDQFLSAPRYRKLDSSGIGKVRPLGVNATSRSVSQISTRSMDMPRSAAESHVITYGQLIAANDLIGMDIENHAGEKIGKVDEAYIDFDSGDVIGVVVSTGTHQNLLNLNEFHYDTEQDKLLVDLNREQLRLAPTYKKDDSSWHDGLRERSIKNPRAVTSIRTNADAVDQSKMTIFSQGNSLAETKMTADIRKAIVDNATLSRRAKNVTIITQKEQVHLRGEVDSITEKTTVENIARTQAGMLNVSSELVVRAR